MFLDEVHKYPDWSQELKNIYDDFPELNVVFTGSSLLEILNAKSDLSRRAIVYEMQGFSFREYLNCNDNLALPAYTMVIWVSVLIIACTEVYWFLQNHNSCITSQTLHLNIKR